MSQFFNKAVFKWANAQALDFAKGNVIYAERRIIPSIKGVLIEVLLCKFYLFLDRSVRVFWQGFYQAQAF